MELDFTWSLAPLIHGQRQITVGRAHKNTIKIKICFDLILISSSMNLVHVNRYLYIGGVCTYWAVVMSLSVLTQGHYI
jgi:hypothetical protein